MRILHVADSFDIGGAERVLISDAIGLRAMGHDVTVACSSGGQLQAVAVAGGVDTLVCQAGEVKRRVSNAFAEALSRMSDAPFDIVHSHMFASHVAAHRVPGLGRSRVLTEHSEGTWRSQTDLQESRLFFNGASAIIAVSRQIADRLTRLDAVPRNQVTTMSNTIPLLPSQPAGSPPLTRTGPTIGVVARLHPEKGVRAFVDAAAAMSRAFPCARFVVAGDGPERNELERRVAQCGMQSRISFLGFVPDGHSLIRQFDILVVPSITEGTPLVVLEAMASGVAIVATRAGGIPEQVRHGCEALLVEAGDVPAIARACTRLLADETLRSRLIFAARLRMRREFNGAHRLHRLDQLYRRVLISGSLTGVAAS
ncbi:MAG: hypothetical protein QOJ19_5036 [Acidimicrobiia bacterium]|nr:hypothetical protein [Acidimicrobiia bacterium]